MSIHVQAFVGVIGTYNQKENGSLMWFTKYTFHSKYPVKHAINDKMRLTYIVFWTPS